MRVPCISLLPPAVLLLLLSVQSAAAPTPASCRQLYCYNSAASARETARQEAFVTKYLANRGPHYLKTANNLMKRMAAVIGGEEDGNEAVSFEVGFPFAWTSVQHIVAAIESAPESAGLWEAAVSVLLKMQVHDETLGLVSDARLLVFVRGATELHARSNAAKAAAFARSFLGKKPHLKAAVQRVMDAPNLGEFTGNKADLEARLLHAQIQRAATEWRNLLTGAAADSKAGSRTGPPLAALDVLPPPASRLLTAIEPDARLSLGGMDTREVWPTRVSKLHLPSTFPSEMGDDFVQRLNAAASRIYGRFRDSKNEERRQAGRPPPKSDEINNGFFAEQGSEE